MTDKTATLDELRAMRKRGEIKPTRDDAPEVDTPNGFWNGAIPSGYMEVGGVILNAALEVAAEDQARIAELEARNGKLGEAVAHATQKFTHQEARIADLADALQSILRIPNTEAAQGIMKAFARNALEPKP